MGESQMTRDEAAARFRDSGICGALSKTSRKGSRFFICSSDAGHDQSARHTACDGQGHVIARWATETSLIEIWLPDGSYHLV